MTCVWLKETWQYVTIHGIDNYNTVFRNVKSVLHQIKLILKFHKDCNFPGRFLNILIIFPAYIFTMIFSKLKAGLISTRTD